MKIGSVSEPKVKTKSSSSGNPVFFQPKLTINQPGDEYEQEADAMAERVMRMEDTGYSDSFFKPVQRVIQRQSPATTPSEQPATREGTPGDVVKAATSIPFVERFLERIGDEFLLTLGTTWDQSTLGKFSLIGGGLSLAGGLGLAVYAARNDPGALDIMASPFSGTMLPAFDFDIFPSALRSFALEVNFDRFDENARARNIMGGIHFDVGRLLPSSWGFGPVQEWSPIGPPWGTTPVHRKCATCEEEDKELQRKELAAQESEANSEISNYIGSLSSKGSPLSHSAKSFFEPRFGYDFSSVKVHNDSDSAASAQSINALAYTTGNNIVFNQHQYSPETERGKQLLAHELTHVVQQNHHIGGIQRKPLSLDRIAKLLNENFWDWDVTNKEAREVLKILDSIQSLFPADFRDTIAEMERRGLVEKLYHEVGKDEQYKYSALFHEIQKNRLVKLPAGKETRDSCVPDKRTKITDTKALVVKWAETGIRILVDFDLRAIDPVKGKKAELLLDKHFYHQKTNRLLWDEEKEKLNEIIAEQFRKVKNFASTPFNFVCASPFDRLCKTLAGAYVSQTKKEAVFCPSFFSGKNKYGGYTLFHELFHSHAGRGDTGYEHERIYKYLPPLAAVNNADSYTNLVLEVTEGSDVADRLLQTPDDKFPDCTDEQKKELAFLLAYADRIITNALNTIGSSEYIVQNLGDAAQKHFKSKNSEDLKKHIKRFQEIDTKLTTAVTIKCSKDAGKHMIKSGAGRIITAPNFYTIRSEDRKMELLLQSLCELGAGLNAEEAAPHAAYALAVSAASDSWKFSGAHVRYADDIIFRANSLRDTYLNQIADKPFYFTLPGSLSILMEDLRKELETSKPWNKGSAESIWAKHEKRIKLMISSMEEVYRWYLPMVNHIFIEGLLKDDPLGTVISKFADTTFSTTITGDLVKLFRNRAGEIQKDTAASIDKWEELKTLKSKYENIMKNLPGYYEAFKKVGSAEKGVEGEKSRILSKTKAEKLLWLQPEIEFLGMAFHNRIWGEQLLVFIEAVSEKPYDPKTSRTGKIEEVQKNYLKEIKEVLAKPVDQTIMHKVIEDVVAAKYPAEKISKPVLTFKGGEFLIEWKSGRTMKLMVGKNKNELVVSLTDLAPEEVHIGRYEFKQEASGWSLGTGTWAVMFNPKFL